MKNTQYQIENYFIDFSRNQISLAGEVTSMQPKVMAVLEQLIQNQGVVVSFEKLMMTVWPDTVVTANTLQRCIFQLRKAFSDDSKLQRVIKTHAKQGYSLIIPARIKGQTVAKNMAQKTTSNKEVIVLMITIMSFSAVLLGNKFLSNPIKNYSQVTSLTSSDAKEAYASYSPDGRFIVFQRNIDACYSELWAKDLVSQQEFKLTIDKGVFGQPDWSHDGNHLVFVERNSCPQRDALATHCWSINTLDFTHAREMPQVASKILDCNEVYSQKAQWLSQGQIGVLQENSSGNMILQSYNPRTKEKITLYAPQEQYIYSYDYSFMEKQYAVLSLTDSNEHKIEILNAQGKKISSNIIEIPSGLSIYKAIESEYHPSADYLIAGTNQGLFRVYPSGKLEPISLTLRHSLYNPSFHPDGKRIIATEVIADTDNSLLNLNEIRVLENKIKNFEPYEIARSNLSDDWAVFAPSGNTIAFTSKRTGLRQVWLKKGEESFQLSEMERGIQNKAIFWSPSGEKIAGLVNNKIQLFSLNKVVEVIDSQLLVTAIMQWPQETELLIKALDKGQEGLYLLNLKTKHLKKLKHTEVAWANSLAGNQLLYLDYNNQVWLVGKENTPISVLNDQLERPVLALDKRKLFGINKQKQLWRYSLDSGVFEVLAQLPSTARYVSDVKEQSLLVTYMNDFRKELVELN
jgi:DNA-binding winged helix-turn-helix (wHTH) protein/Tol biopolymer transport system component